MKKIRFLIAYGPTRERLDPVRFLSNDSTGTMGRSLVEAAKTRKQAVVSVSCPDQAESALDLHKKLKSLLPKCDVLVMAAAVCDARPAKMSKKKISKESLKNIRLVKNPDILMDLAKRKRKNQVFIGFGIESEDLLRRGFEKLKKKGLDLIVLQKVSQEVRPFGDKKIEAFVLDGHRQALRFASIDKRQLAQAVIGAALDLFAHECSFC